MKRTAVEIDSEVLADKGDPRLSVVELVEQNPGLTASQLAQISNRKLSSLSSTLNKLVLAKKIKRKEQRGMRSGLAWRYYSKVWTKPKPERVPRGFLKGIKGCANPSKPVRF